MTSEQPSAFRGSAGEVVGGFVHPVTLATLLPVLLVMVLLGLLAALTVKLVGLSAPFVGLLALVTSSPLIGRIAMAARDGQLDAGLFTSRADRGAVLGFVLRHATLCVVWGLPFSVIAHFLLSSVGEASLLGLAGLTGASMALLLLLAAAVVAQLLSLLIATRADTVGQAVSIEAWRWALVERRTDLVPLAAALVGGLVVFAMVAWPALGLVALVAGKASLKVGAAIGVLAHASPMLAAPVLLGRLCGAFVFSEEPLGSAPPIPTFIPVSPATGSRLVAVVPPAPTPGEAAVQAARRIDVKQALDGVRVKAATDLEGAIKEAQILRDAYLSNPQVAVELAQLLEQAGRHDEAVAAASGAIKAALSAGTAPVAVEVWTAFAGSRDQLALDAATLEALGRQLINRKELNDAAWCFRSMKERGADPIRIQKGLIGVADASARDGNLRGAIQLYRFILSEFPRSTLREYIESALAQLELRAASGR